MIRELLEACNPKCKSPDDETCIYVRRGHCTRVVMKLVYLFALQFDQSIADLSAELMRDHHDRFRILHEERHQPDGQQFVVVGFVSRANYAPVEGVDHLSESGIVINDSL
jgi:hypothetical protein